MRTVGEQRCRKVMVQHQEHHWYDALNDQWVLCDGRVPADQPLNQKPQVFPLGTEPCT